MDVSEIAVPSSSSFFFLFIELLQTSEKYRERFEFFMQFTSVLYNVRYNNRVIEEIFNNMS